MNHLVIFNGNTQSNRRSSSLNAKFRTSPLTRLHSFSRPNIFSHISNYTTTHKLFLSNDIELVKNLDFDKNCISFPQTAPTGEALRQAIDNNPEIVNHRLGLTKKPLILQNVIQSGRNETTEESNSNSSRKASIMNVKGFEMNHIEKEMEELLMKEKEEYESMKKKRFELQMVIKNELKNIDAKNLELEMLDKNSGELFPEHADLAANNNIKKKTGKLNLFILKTLHAQEHNTKLQKKEEIRQEKEASMSKIQKTEKELSELKITIAEKKKFINENTNKLMYHYQKLLYEGSDVRQEGLIWIIKAIWNLGKNVPMEFFPTFLDFEAIDYLFTIAHKTIELSSTKNEISKIKQKLHKELKERKEKAEKEQNENEKADELFRTSVFPTKNKIMIKALSQNDIFMKKKKEENEEINLKKIKLMVMNRKSAIDADFLEHISQIDVLSLKIKNIEKEIASLKRQQLNRIFKEFTENDYQRRYNVIIDVVIAALIGEYNKNNEMIKIAQKKKKYKQDIKHIQFFNVAVFPRRNKSQRQSAFK